MSCTRIYASFTNKDPTVKVISVADPTPVQDQHMPGLVHLLYTPYLLMLEYSHFFILYLSWLRFKTVRRKGTFVNSSQVVGSVIVFYEEKCFSLSI